MSNEGQAAFDRAIEALPDKVELVYVDHRDQLTDEQLQTVLTESLDAVLQDVDEQAMDLRDEGVWAVLEDCLDTEDLDLLRADHVGLFDELRYALQARDVSDPFRDLLRNSGGRLVRYRLDYDLAPGSWSWSAQEADDAARDLAEAAGLAYEGDTAQACRDLVANASGGGSLWVVWDADVEDLHDALSYGADDNKPVASGTITWTDPCLLVLDSFNGSGHDARIEGELSAAFDPARLTLDSQGPGYSWQDVSGAVPSGYDSKWKIEG